MILKGHDALLMDRGRERVRGKMTTCVWACDAPLWRLGRDLKHDLYQATFTTGTRKLLQIIVHSLIGGHSFSATNVIPLVVLCQ